QRAEEPIADLAYAITHVRRPENRDHQIRTGLDSPVAECLAEVLLVLVQTDFGGGVEQAADAHRRVQEEAPRILPETPEFELQQVVDHRDRIEEVVHEIGHAGTHRARYDLLISASHRPRDRMIDRHVDLEGRAIQSFPRVTRIAFGVRWKGCAPEYGQA